VRSTACAAVRCVVGLSLLLLAAAGFMCVSVACTSCQHLNLWHIPSGVRLQGSPESVVQPCLLVTLLLLLPVAAAAAFRSGAVMGFLLAGFGLLNLYLGVMLFKWVSVNARRVTYRSRTEGLCTSRDSTGAGLRCTGTARVLALGCASLALLHDLSVCARIIPSGLTCQRPWSCWCEHHYTGW
jgi:hypothetical protein